MPGTVLGTDVYKSKMKAEQENKIKLCIREACTVIVRGVPVEHERG